MKLINNKRVYEAILNSILPITRGNLVKELELPRSTIYDAIVRLEGKKLVSRKTLTHVRKKAKNGKNNGRYQVGFFAISSALV